MSARMTRPGGSWGLAPGELWARTVDLDRDHPAVVDTAAAAAFAAATAVWLLHRPGVGVADWACDAALVAPLPWRRARPTAVFAVIAGVALVQWAVAGPLLADTALLAALFTVASERPRREWVTAAAVVEVGVVLASLRWGFTGSWIRSLTGLSGLALAVLLAAMLARSRRAHQHVAADRALRLQHERDQQAQIAAAAERARIAREMHDVIAHSLAVMISLADGAGAKLPHDPDRAATAVSQVAATGRQALGETRRLLGVLRQPEGGDGRAPQPGLAELDSLLAPVRATGLQAELRTEGTPFEVGAGLALTVFRIVQEATTNALKHAVGATRVDVLVAYDRQALRIEVCDDGAATAAPPSSSGHGLGGMRERVALYDGTLDAGPTPDGFRIAARLRAPATADTRPDRVLAR